MSTYSIVHTILYDSVCQTHDVVLLDTGVTGRRWARTSGVTPPRRVNLSLSNGRRLLVCLSASQTACNWYTVVHLRQFCGLPKWLHPYATVMASWGIILRRPPFELSESLAVPVPVSPNDSCGDWKRQVLVRLWPAWPSICDDNFACKVATMDIDWVREVVCAKNGG
jgi:hypothetical protein